MNAVAPVAATRPLRLGFLGVGWIGRHRMQALLDTGFVEACAICDPSSEMAATAREAAPSAALVDDLRAILALEPDGVLIATPSALHAEQSIAALEAGAAVFCQKPLGRSAQETLAVLDAARRADRLLGVDLSYRHTDAMRAIRDLVRERTIGEVYAVDLVFHNAYGPDKPWFYDRSQSGGGCVMDLGVHLADLLLWTLDFPATTSVSSNLFSGGRRWDAGLDAVEDYGVATIGLETGAVARLACSWRLHAGCEAVISATFHGTEGSLAMQNVRGSFYDFTGEIRRGTSSEVIATPPDDWGGRAAQAWAAALAVNNTYDPQADRLVDVAKLLDRIYAGAP